jgi:hypothetical protein
MIADSVQSAPIAQPEAKKGSSSTWFTKDNARIMSERGRIEIQRRKQLRAIGQPEQPIIPDEKFRLLNLSRVRVQLERLHKDLRLEQDCNKFDKIASAIDRLSRLERDLACPDQSSQSGSTSRQRPPKVS